MYALAELPDLPLLKIFYNLDIEFLLKDVSVVCKRFNKIILNKSVLWKDITFGNALTFIIGSVNVEQYTQLFVHIKSFQRLQIPYSEFHFDASTFLQEDLIQTVKLQHLDLTASPITTLGFIKCLPHLHTLILSE